MLYVIKAPTVTYTRNYITTEKVNRLQKVYSRAKCGFYLDHSDVVIIATSKRQCMESSVQSDRGKSDKIKL